MMRFLSLLACICLLSCKSPEKETKTHVSIPVWEHPYQAISQLGDTLYAKNPSENIKTQLIAKKKAFEAHPDNLDHLIWYGRFTAYTGDYRKAIQIYSEGLQKFPDESRLLRHRGHRYITVREFDNAIRDLEKASELIEGTENKIEEDGLPNKYNIPVSTQHGNIYYHLGLAYYLNRNFPKALEAYEKCFATSSNPDNVVSATHWIYMIQRRMNHEEAAAHYLRNVTPDMNVLENLSYHKACLFYKGELELEAVYPIGGEDSPSNSALAYAVGNWYWYNGQSEQAQGIYRTLLASNDWASFGYLAAEADMAQPMNTY